MIPNGNKNLLLANTDLSSDYRNVNLVRAVEGECSSTCRFCLRSWLFRPLTFSLKAFGSSGNGVPVSGLGGGSDRLNASAAAVTVVLSFIAVVLASVAPSCSRLEFPRFLVAIGLTSSRGAMCK